MADEKCPGPEGGRCVLGRKKPVDADACRHCRCGYSGCTKRRVNMEKSCREHRGQVE